MKLRNKKTGEITTAVYAPYRNKMVYHVAQPSGDMKPFSDREFSKTYEILQKP